MKFFIPKPAFSALFLLGMAPLPTTWAQTPELAVKQDFEATDSVREWRLQTPNGAKPFLVTRDNAPQQAHSGEAALKYDVTESGEQERYIFSGAKLPASDGQVARTLRIRFFARTAAEADQPFTFRVLERSDKPTGWIGGKTETVRIDPTAQWKEFSFTGNLAATTQGLTLYFVAKKPQAGQALWIDDLSIEAIPVAP